MSHSHQILRLKHHFYQFFLAKTNMNSPTTRRALQELSRRPSKVSRIEEELLRREPSDTSGASSGAEKPDMTQPDQTRILINPVPVRPDTLFVHSENNLTIPNFDIRPHSH